MKKKKMTSKKAPKKVKKVVQHKKKAKKAILKKKTVKKTPRVRKKINSRVKTVKNSIKDPIPKDLFDILACPMCKGDLRYDAQKTALLCKKCSIKFPIRDGIPILLPPEMQ